MQVTWSDMGEETLPLYRMRQRVGVESDCVGHKVKVGDKLPILRSRTRRCTFNGIETFDLYNLEERLPYSILRNGNPYEYHVSLQSRVIDRYLNGIDEAAFALQSLILICTIHSPYRIISLTYTEYP